ncbi:hypothetical protein [Microbulbifer sp. MCCC 1A16149]|uniref:hypothetical protein n=1 Tax=Microbulbifer sp. MCCC 1A16149 TaxID=3411322 RepID=UPI003D0A2153
MLCHQVNQLIEWEGAQAVRRRPQLARHLFICGECRARVQHAEQRQLDLQRALADMPVPDPGKDFEARLLANLQPRRQPSAQARRWPQDVLMPVALPLAMAASLLMGVLLAPQLSSRGGVESVPPAEYALHPVHVRLDSPRALSDATIRIHLPAHTSLEGFRGVQTLQWQTDIPAGGNRITLPLQVDSIRAEGSLTVEVEYRGAKKTLYYRIPDAKPTASSSPQSLTNI